MKESIRASTEPIVWLMLVTTGILLAVLLPAHVYLTHLIGAGFQIMDFDAVLARLSSAPMKTFYFLTLLALVFHGWGGVRGMLFDIERLQVHRRKIDVSIVAVGSITLIYGVYLLLVVGK